MIFEFNGICNGESAKLGREMEEFVQNKAGSRMLGQPSGSTAQRDLKADFDRR